MELSNVVSSLKEDYKAGQDKDGNKYNKETLSDIRKTLKIYTSKLNYATNVSKRLDNYPTDVIHNLVISLGGDNKYFKRISNAYDRRQVRTDEGVYFDYLKNMSSTLERNHLIAALVKSLIMSKMKNTPKMHKIVSRASINHFKVPFHGTDIYRTGFLNRILPLPQTTDDINTMLNWIPGRNRTAIQLNKTYRIIASYLTGTYLSGLGTTVQNMTDSLRNIIYSSFGEFKDGLKLMTGVNKDKIQRIIELAGFTEFSDFFSRSMVNGVVDRQIEAAIADGILKAMMDYHNSNRGAGLRQIKKNYDKFEKTVNELLASSE